jgi:hypothetical protein
MHCFEAEIDFAGGDVLTRVPSSNLGKQITGATTLAHGCDKYPKSFVEPIDMFVGCGRVTLVLFRTRRRAEGSRLKRRCEASRSKKPSEGSRWRGGRGSYAN